MAHRAVARVVTHQRVQAADPDPPLRILGHRLRPVDAVDGLQVLLHRAAGRVEAVQRAAGADHPDAAGGGGRHRQRIGVAQRGRIVQVPRQHRELPPVRRQVPQAGIGAGEPQPAVAILVGGAPVRLDQPALLRAVQRHVAHRGAVAAAPQALQRVQPVIAVGRVLQHVEHLAGCGTGPFHPLETAIAVAHHHPAVGRDPQPLAAIDLQAVDARRGQERLALPLEAAAGPARQSALASHPQHAVGGDRQIGDRGRRQAVALAGDRHETLDRAVHGQPVQAGGRGAEPDAAIRRGGHAPHGIAGDLRIRIAVEEAEAAAIGRQHAQARVLRTEPQPVGRVHVQAPDQVVAQAVLGPPDAVVAPVEARQPIMAGQPQITEPVLGECIDVGRRQAIGDAQAARLRGDRHLGRGLRHHAGQQQAQQPPQPAAHGMPHGCRPALADSTQTRTRTGRGPPADVHPPIPPLPPFRIRRPSQSVSAAENSIRAGIRPAQAAAPPSFHRRRGMRPAAPRNGHHAGKTAGTAFSLACQRPSEHPPWSAGTKAAGSGFLTWRVDGPKGSRRRRREQSIARHGNNLHRACA